MANGRHRDAALAFASYKAVKMSSDGSLEVYTENLPTTVGVLPDN
jgi:hypothetical protein